MKIGICIRTWEEAGGIGVYTRNMLPELLEMDQKNEYFLFYNKQDEIEHFQELNNVHEICVPSKNKLIWDQVLTPWHANRLKINVILHTKLTIPLLTRKKTVMVLHGTERFFFPFTPLSDRLYFKTIYPQYLKRATAIISVCENARKDVIEVLNLDPDKIKTVHLAGHPASRVIQSEIFLKSIKDKYQLPKRFIIYVGHIYPGKNVGRLFQALSLVRKHEDISLVMVGKRRWKFEYELGLINKLKLDDHVQFLGYVPLEDLIALYNLAELTAFPSYYECFPAIPLDANACGCPVVTSRTGGTPEAAGDAAVYVEPTDITGISDAILRVLTDVDLRKNLIEKGFQNARRFSWRKTAQETLAVLESLG